MELSFKQRYVDQLLEKSLRKRIKVITLVKSFFINKIISSSITAKK